MTTALNDREVQILQLLAKNSELSGHELAYRLAVRNQEFAHNLSYLCGQGLVAYQNTLFCVAGRPEQVPSTIWRITEAGKAATAALP